MRNRKRVPRGQSKRRFTKHAVKQHVRNLPSRPMRGGIRL